ncbi:hypothetical protein LI170_16670, partial [Desulfovibrio desulfuricans]
YVNQKGTLYIKDHTSVNIGKLDVVRDAMHKQQSGVSKQLEQLYGEDGILYAVPFYVKGETKGAMVAWNSTADLQLLSDT